MDRAGEAIEHVHLTASGTRHGARRASAAAPPTMGYSAGQLLRVARRLTITPSHYTRATEPVILHGHRRPGVRRRLHSLVQMARRAGGATGARGTRGVRVFTFVAARAVRHIQ